VLTFWDGRVSGATCVVAGFAETLSDDISRVHQALGSLPTIAVNRAAGWVRAGIVFSWHYDRLKAFADMQANAFGGWFKVHSIGPAADQPHVQAWHPDCASKGTSGWCAARLARKLGYERIILCGVPMQPAPYADHSIARAFQGMGGKAVDLYRDAIATDTDLHPYVRSMSGWTRDILGFPEEVSHEAKRSAHPSARPDSHRAGAVHAEVRGPLPANAGDDGCQPRPVPERAQ
jgi:hypothetical protein